MAAAGGWKTGLDFIAVISDTLPLNEAAFAARPDVFPPMGKSIGSNWTPRGSDFHRNLPIPAAWPEPNSSRGISKVRKQNAAGGLAPPCRNSRFGRNPGHKSFRSQRQCQSFRFGSGPPAAKRLSSTIQLTDDGPVQRRPNSQLASRGRHSVERLVVPGTRHYSMKPRAMPQRSKYHPKANSRGRAILEKVMRGV
jgi:hypothetical protein